MANSDNFIKLTIMFKCSISFKKKRKKTVMIINKQKIYSSIFRDVYATASAVGIFKNFNC